MNGIIALLIFTTLMIVAYYAFTWAGKRMTRWWRARQAPIVLDAPAPVVKADVPQKFETFETRLKGDLNVGGTSTFPGNVLLQGNLIVEDEGVFNGAAEVFGNVILGVRAHATEPLIVHGNLTLREGASVRATRVEGDVTLERGAIVDGPLDCETMHLVEDAPVAHATPEAHARSAAK